MTQCVFSSSNTANGTEFTVYGVVILVTLINNNKDGERLASSFALSFLRKPNEFILIPGRILHQSTFVTEEGRAVASFPQNNVNNYKNNANHFLLISRPSGRDFNLTLTFIDIEPFSAYFRRFLIQDDSKETRFGGGGEM